MDNEAARYLEENIAVLEEYSERACTLAVDNAEWSRICKALAGWKITQILVPLSDAQQIESLRCLIGAVYAMGYERGKRIGNMPNFVVAPEEGE